MLVPCCARLVSPLISAIEGALFLYRHRRRQVLDSSDTERSTGVRLSIPLHRILDVHLEGMSCNSMSTASLRVQLSPTDTNGFDPQSIRNSEIETLRFCQPVSITRWHQLEHPIATAKARQKRAGSVADISPLIVDFGPLTFSDEGIVKAKDSDIRTDTEKAVRRALALEDDTQAWSKLHGHSFHVSFLT